MLCAKIYRCGIEFHRRAAISQVLLGYIYVAADTGVIKGLSNESLNGEIPISRAETVNMIFVHFPMWRRGINRGIKVFVQSYPSQGKQTMASLSTLVQVIDGRGLPLGSRLGYRNVALYGVELENSLWNPTSQQGAYTLNTPFQSSVQDARYEVSFNPIGDYTFIFSAPARLLHGELMILVYTPGILAQTNLDRHELGPGNQDPDGDTYVFFLIQF